MHGTPSEVAITRALLRKISAPDGMSPPPVLSKTFMKNHAGDFHLDANHHRHQFPDGRVGSDSDLGTAEHAHSDGRERSSILRTGRLSSLLMHL